MLIFTGVCLLGAGSVIAGPLAFATNQQSSNISVIDTETNSVISTIAVGKEPAGVSVGNEGNLVFVSNPGDGTVLVIDARSGELVDTIETGDGPRAYGNFITDQ